MIENSSPREVVSNCVVLISNQGAERVKMKWTTTVHTPHVGILAVCTKGLNELRKAYLVLADVMREVRVLKEHVSDTVRGSAAPVR